jgi:hypothetical protein
MVSSKQVRWIPVAAAALLLMVGIVQAQVAGPTTCPSFIEEALAAMGDNCGEMGRNTACYGYNQIDTTFTVAVDESVFTVPSDRAELTNLETVRTAPLDIDRDLWGIAVMNVQANVPGTVPGQAVSFLLAGDATVTNAVDPSDVVTAGADPIEVLTAVSANLRSGPGTQNNVVGGARPGETLLADSISEDGGWVRVFFNDRLAWISLDVLEANDAISALPLADAATLSPMQAFYFTTGIGQAQCNEAPDLIAIRSPEGLRVSLTANGASFTIGSTVMFRQTEDGTFTITVLDGSLITADGTVVEAGQTIVASVDEDGNFTVWEEVRPATEEELAAAPTIGLALEELGIFDLQPTPEPGDGNTSNPERGPLSCAGFAPTSPLGGLAYGANTFFWDAAQGVDSYRVTVFNQEQGGSVSFDTVGAETNVSGLLNQNTIGSGFSFAWQVEAIRDGQVVCSSQVIEMARAADPGPAGPGFSATWFCDAPGALSIIVQWSGLPAGQTVTFDFDNEGYPTTMGPYSTSSGSDSYYTEGSNVASGVATTSGGLVVPLPGSYNCP